MVNNGITSVYRDGSVTVGDTPVGKGVFSELSYPANAIIGEITGDVVKDAASGSAYTFEIDERTQLEPYAPYRYLNHSCEPNCEFDWFDDDKLNGDVAPLYLIALRDIWPGEELTIDYHWPAISAISGLVTASSIVTWPASASVATLVIIRKVVID